MSVANVRILQVVTGSDWGGAQQHVLWLAQGLRERGIAVSVACQPGGYLVDRLKQAGIAVWVLPDMARRISPLQDWRTYLDLRRVLGEGQYDLVHAHSSKAGALARLAAAAAGIPAVFTAHGLVFSNTAMPGWKRWGYARAEQLLGRYAAHLIAVSGADGALAEAHRLVPGDRLTVIHNGVPVPRQEELPALRAAGRERLGLRPDAIVVGTIARLHPDKDLATWLQAAALAHKRLPSLEFLIIGDGPEGAALHRFASELGLAGVVTWTGEQPDAARLLPAMDIFALSSVKEGLPLTLLEAMACGLPVAATSVGGIPEAVEDGRTGLLTPPRNPAALASAMLRLAAGAITPGDDLSGAGARGRVRVQSAFSVDSVVEQTVAVYQKVLAIHQVRRTGGGGV
ncbi:MAG: glycosyltransferase family 4 protein [Symbiobacteriia bacterium]